MIELKSEDYRRYLVCLWEGDSDDWHGQWFRNRDEAENYYNSNFERCHSAALYDLDGAPALCKHPKGWDGHTNAALGT